jgi:hypothetical protein
MDLHCTCKYYDVVSEKNLRKTLIVLNKNKITKIDPPKNHTDIQNKNTTFN